MALQTKAAISSNLNFFTVRIKQLPVRRIGTNCCACVSAMLTHDLPGDKLVIDVEHRPRVSYQNLRKKL